MISPRATRLVRAADLRSFRRALATLCTAGAPLDARDRLVIVPTRAASLHLVRTIEDLNASSEAVVLPDFVTRAELHERLAERLPPGESAAGPRFPYSNEERTALLSAACRAAIDAGAEPPFRIRPGLVAEMLDFFDLLKRHQKSIDDFERLTIGCLEGGAADRGAERLLRQTRFLVTAFRDFVRRCEGAGGLDEHATRAQLLGVAAARPWRHIIVAVRDRAADRYGLFPVDWDLLARIPGLQHLDVVITDTALAGAFHQRIHQWLPGIDEVRAEPSEPTAPCEPSEPLRPRFRDREEELIGFARWVRTRVDEPETAALDRFALVVRQPLPYVYLAREVFRAAGVPCQMFDALPLAAEPYAGAVDLLFSFVNANFARGPAVALLQSPHLTVRRGESGAIRATDIAALDRALSEHGYLGGLDALDAIVASWHGEPSRVARGALAAAIALQRIAGELAPLRSPAPVADHVDRVIRFLMSHERVPGPDEPLRARQLRARGAVLALLRGMRDAYRRFDPRDVAFDEVTAMVRRGIDARTFAPRSGDSGVHVVDADSAPFGEFDCVHLAGLVDGEWPDRPRRNIFYSPGMLRDLGWPADVDRLEAIRAGFRDLLQLPAKALVVSTFALEHDTVVSPSMLLDEVQAAHADAPPAESDAVADVESIVLSDPAYVWAKRRLERPADSVAGGRTAPHHPAAYSVSSLERYQDCPFRFFAADVLGLDDVPEDEAALSPRARGRFIHEVFQRFFEAWDRRGERVITAERLDAARQVFAEVAEPLLARLPDADAALERTRLFGSAISVGMIDVVLGVEAAQPVEVLERLLEYRLDGSFSLGGNAAPVPLRGVADRIDLLAGHRLRIIDYKSGSAPNPKRALQLPIYTLCAQERLAEQGRGSWAVNEAAYVAFSGRRTLVPVISQKGVRDEAAKILGDARARLLDIVGGIERGEFPVRPYESRICSYCAYPSVCRKDYVGDE
jgi:RecB family exonuclease